MASANEFLRLAVERDFDFWTGVPCSWLDPLMTSVHKSDTVPYYGATNEGEAIALAMGAHLGGASAVVMLQNSGLGNAINPLSTLIIPFDIPLLLVISLRGDPRIDGQPQHEMMGEITPDLLEQLDIAWAWFPEETYELADVLDEARATMSRRARPFALIVRQGIFDEATATEYSARSEAPSHCGVPVYPNAAVTPAQRGYGIRRDQVISMAWKILGDNHALIGATGEIGRELLACGHRRSQLYVVGGMGCASAIGFGLHEGSRGRIPIAVLDGDGGTLMRLGTLTTIGHYSPSRFRHIVLDNEAHQSTGGQPTSASTADIAALASASGYDHVVRVRSRESLEEALYRLKVRTGPSLLHVKIRDRKPSAPDLPRPAHPPHRIKEHFVQWRTAMIQRSLK